MKWWIIVLFVILGLLLLPIFFLFPGTILLALCLGAIVFCIVRIKKTQNRFFLIGIVLSVGIILYSSFTIHAPVEVNVINALTKQPVEGIQVVREIQGTRVVMNPGGEYASRLDAQKGLSSYEGKYDFGWIFSANFPFYIAFNTDRAVVGGNCHIYHDEKCIDETKYNDHYFAYSIKDSLVNQYPDVKQTSSYALLTKKRFSFMPKKITFYLMPLVNTFVECDFAPHLALVNICKQANINHLAILNNNAELCLLEENSFYREYCVLGVARENNNLAACELLGTLPGTYYHNTNPCERIIAAQTSNQSLCESIQNSIWRYGESYNSEERKYVESWNCVKKNDSQP